MLWEAGRSLTNHAIHHDEDCDDGGDDDGDDDDDNTHTFYHHAFNGLNVFSISFLQVAVCCLT